MQHQPDPETELLLTQKSMTKSTDYQTDEHQQIYSIHTITAQKICYMILLSVRSL